MEYEVKHEINEGNILDILTTAIEGGIGYWACLLNDDRHWIKAREQWKTEHNGETPCYCDVAYQVMKNNHAVKFEDVEDGSIYELTLDKLLNGCKIYVEKTKRDIHQIMNDSDFDAEDADMIIQYALFGEIVFG